MKSQTRPTPVFLNRYQTTPEKGKIFYKASVTEQSHDVSLRQILDRATRMGLPIPTAAQDRLYFDENQPMPDFSKMDFAELHDYALTLRSKRAEAEKNQNEINEKIAGIEAQAKFDAAVAAQVEKTKIDPKDVYQ